MICTGTQELVPKINITISKSSNSTQDRHTARSSAADLIILTALLQLPCLRGGRMGCNCTKTPPPEEFKAAVGTWKGLNSEGATVTFVLFGEGSFYFGKETGHSSVSMQGPINKWSGGSFDSKPCCFCSWHFELEKPVDGPEEGLTMLVNGVQLSYTGLPSVSSAS